MATPMSPPPQKELEGCNTLQNTLYSHFTHRSQDSDWFDRLNYIYQHFQDSEKMYQLDLETKTPVPDDDTLYPYINNDIEYGLFEDVVDSYYLDSQIKDDFQCNHDCYTHQWESTVDDHSISCTHEYDHIVQHIQDLPDSTQQHTLHSMEENTSLFTDDAATPCDFNIANQNSITENTNDTSIPHIPKHSGIHAQSKHTYRNTFGKSNIQYHDFDNQDSLTFTDKYTALLQQELQNPYWSLHDPVTTKSYQISKDMDIETMPHAMYFTSNNDTVTKINHVPYQTIEYNDNGMFTAKLMDDTPVEIFIDNELHLPSSHYIPIINSPFYIHTQRQKVTLL